MLKLFFSYSHRDETLRDELEVHLATLKRQGVIDAWHDRRIVPGSKVDSEISKHLEESQIVLLLISAYFIASDYCYDIEMKRALERHESGECQVIPVILHPCDWTSLQFGKLLATPKDGKPISKYPNQHDAFLEVTTAIRDAAKHFSTKSISQSIQPQLQEKPDIEKKAAPTIRSSNLRVKKTFTDREKDKFEREAFEYIANFFEGSLSEIEARNQNIETDFRRIDANRFTSAIYKDGAEASSCEIRFNGRGSIISGIAFSHGDSLNGTGFNEMLSTHDDGYNLYLKPLGLNMLRSNENQQLSFEGAAEAFWEMFIQSLQ